MPIPSPPANLLDRTSRRTCCRVNRVDPEWIATVVTKQCPNAVLCADPFHMVAWVTA
ncbi:MAG: transposase, partial [Cryobacterium sp.]|nr:transposase [Cryobacterium sp.]